MGDKGICRIKYKFQIVTWSLSFLAAIVTGCAGILPCDDQVSLPPHIEKVVNPQPVQRNFIQNNRYHKILVAIIDSGVDYNHPALLDNIHFSLDINNQPLKLGWDFIGQEFGCHPLKGFLSRQIALLGNETGVQSPCIAQRWSGFMTADIQDLSTTAAVSLILGSVHLTAPVTHQD